MGQGKNVVAQCTYPRSQALPVSVMCADARTRGCQCVEHPTCGVLPQLNQKLGCYYMHIAEFADKLKADLKRVGCWGVSPLTGLGVEGLSVPASDLKSVNVSRLKTSFHRWDPYNAPVPRFTGLLCRTSPSCGTPSHGFGIRRPGTSLECPPGRRRPCNV